jgi:hypothetical protein
MSRVFQGRANPHSQRSTYNNTTHSVQKWSNPGHSSNTLSSQDSELFLASFPTTRLSYEAVIHKNDNPSFFTGRYKCFILPKGKRCVAWVTEWKREKIVAVIDITNNYQGVLSPVIRKFHQENGWYPGSIRLYDACMDHSLVYGTVFSGVLFRSNHGGSVQGIDKTFFSIHSVYWYKGNLIPPLTLSGHVRLCERIFDEAGIRQVAYTKQNSIIFGLPMLCHNVKDIDRMISELPYTIFAVQYRFENHTKVCIRHVPFQSTDSGNGGSVVVPPKIQQPSPPAPAPAPAPAPVHPSTITSRMPYVQPQDEMLTNIQAVFMVRPNIQNDIYELFMRSSSSRTGELVFHNFAHISGYKTSVMMNRLFRNIVENERLDAQEESEDEADFENTEPDKYVSLHKELLMICRFNKRFCRWVPIQVVSSSQTTTTNSQIITDQQVKQHEMRYLKYHRK